MRRCGFEQFRNTSYSKRYELLMLKLIRERRYDSACLILSAQKSGQQGLYIEPCEELTFERFVTGLTGHAGVCAALAARK